MLRWTMALLVGIAAPGLAWAQVAGGAGVPSAQRPPPGMCRIWMDGVPPAHQPAPTDCATAIRRRPPNAHVIFGAPARSPTRDLDDRAEPPAATAPALLPDGQSAPESGAVRAPPTPEPPRTTVVTPRRAAPPAGNERRAVERGHRRRVLPIVRRPAPRRRPSRPPLRGLRPRFVVRH